MLQCRDIYSRSQLRVVYIRIYIQYDIPRVYTKFRATSNNPYAKCKNLIKYIFFTFRPSVPRSRTVYRFPSNNGPFGGLIPNMNTVPTASYSSWQPHSHVRFIHHANNLKLTTRFYTLIWKPYFSRCFANSDRIRIRTYTMHTAHVKYNFNYNSFIVLQYSIK